MKNLRLLSIATVALFLGMIWFSVAQAQMDTRQPVSLEDTNRIIPAGLLDSAIKPFPRLKFPSELKTFSSSSNIENAIFKPTQGEGPFPAIVLVPTCGGTSGRPEIAERTQEFLSAGYAVLVLENYKPRGQKNCRNNVVTGALIWRDVIDALAHLHTLKDVNKDRIYQVGYSIGAFSAAALSSRAINAYFDNPLRFKASVGWYGSCASQSSPKSRVSYLLRADMEHPVLMLMSEADKETPARPFCFPLLDQLKAAGRPIDWFFYDKATHSWDDRTGYTLPDNGWGETVVNTYDAKTTEDAIRRTLEFLSRHP